jgi:hypothetical protein
LKWLIGFLSAIYNKRRRGKMTESKKEWQKPELIVLVRSKPEEAVLAGCKGHSIGGGTSDTNTVNTLCSSQYAGCWTCDTLSET